MFNQLCVWPGNNLEGSSVNELIDFFHNEVGVRVKSYAEVPTPPSLDSVDKPVPGKGGGNPQGRGTKNVFPT